jgi:hypothetical protein
MSAARQAKRGLATLFAALLIGTLTAACGGGGGSVAGGGIGGTGITSGQITGFGSVIVNGQKFEVETSTQITVDDVNQAQTNLQVGMIVTVEHTNFTDGRLRADKINYQSDVRGPATLAGQTLSVAGQTIVVTDQTCVQVSSDQTECVTGAAGLALLQSNDAVDICGNRDATGQLRATRVRKMTRTSREVEVRGQVQPDSLTATTFVLNGLTVSYASVLPTGGTLANGATVEVKAAQGPVGNVLTASAVKVESSGSGGGSGGSTPTVEVENLITRFDSATPTDFDVGTQKVQTTASTTYENGGPAHLAANIKVKVKGKRNASNVLVADLVSLRPTIEIEARVDAITPAESGITVLGLAPGVKVKTNNLTTFKGSGSGGSIGFSQIAVGDNLKITAQQSDQGIVAIRVERVNNLNNIVLRAPVSAKSGSSFTQLGITVQTSGSTQFSSDLGGVNDQTTFFSNVTPNQTVVKTEGSLAGSNTINADEVEIELPD